MKIWHRLEHKLGWYEGHLVAVAAELARRYAQAAERIAKEDK